MIMSKNKSKVDVPIVIKKIIVFFILFSITYWLLNYFFNEVLYLIYKDAFHQIHNDNNQRVIHRLLEFDRWSRIFKPCILVTISSLICIWIVLIKRKYLREAIIAFFTFIFTLCIINLSSKLYHNKQEKDRNIYTKLIIGRWNHKSSSVGNVVIIFNQDKTGVRFSDSIKTVQNFHYSIIAKNSSLAIFFESNKSEFYYIDSLTNKILNIRAGPFTKLEGNVYVSNFKRDTR
jgi:FlaA1/EpsC-like NDP-sugar epimerase